MKFFLQQQLVIMGLSVLVQLKVYDILGEMVAVLVDEEKGAGNYEIKFNASKLSSGVYFYPLRTGKYSHTNKMLILK